MLEFPPFFFYKSVAPIQQPWLSPKECSGGEGGFQIRPGMDRIFADWRDAEVEMGEFS